MANSSLVYESNQLVGEGVAGRLVVAKGSDSCVVQKLLVGSHWVGDSKTSGQLQFTASWRITGRSLSLRETLLVPPEMIFCPLLFFLVFRR